MTTRNNKTIDRREFLKQSTVGAITASLAPCIWLTGCSKKQDRGKNNVILVVIDSLRADHVGCLGYHRNTTPNIDALAKESFLFKNAISQAPWTLPSVASMLTSQFPTVLGIHDQPVALTPHFPLMSELLSKAGYTTGGVVSHNLISKQLGFGRGFDSYEEEGGFGRIQISSPSVTSKAISFMQNNRRRNFFLFLHYFDPHYNYILHEKYNYYKSYTGPVKSGHSIISLWRNRHRLSQDDIKYLLSLYDSEIAFTDEHMGILFDELKKLGIYDNSIIIITADHGDEFMERGWIGHCTSLYQELLHVPLIIKVPGKNAQIVNSPVGLIDIMPTVLEYLDCDIPENLDGKALNFNSHEIAGTGPIFSETFNHVLQKHQLPDVNKAKRLESIALQSVILGDHKLIYDEKKELEQLFNLSSDPSERKNISNKDSTEDKRLKALLFSWLKYIGAKQIKGPSQDINELFTPDQRKQLESLGYL